MGMAKNQMLSGMRVLVVEDEPMIAMAVEDILTDSGCHVVGPAYRLEEAWKLVVRDPIDGAVLDVNVAGEMVFPLADWLSERSIPFVFVSGYGRSDLRDCDLERPLLQKPYRAIDLLNMTTQWRRHH